MDAYYKLKRDDKTPKKLDFLFLIPATKMIL